jgi:16S rRNA (guanine527-N7)-methyltransferase
MPTLNNFYEEISKKYNIELSTKELEKFKKFLQIFKEKNSKINLSSIRTDDDIINKHFIDSIILNSFLDFKSLTKNKKIKIADIGTWWWFPWIPLAITNPELNFTLIDSVWKKIIAVGEFCEKLNLKNIKTLNKRAEEIWQDKRYREKFDFVVSRATAYFPTLLEYSIPLLKIWWIFIAYKLDDKEELKIAKKSLIKLGAKIIRVKNYKLVNQKRTLVFIEKIKKTAEKYPRRVGIPQKEPIV